MRAVIQRVNQAEVRVGGAVVGAIGAGYLLLLGVDRDDGTTDVDFMVRKVPDLRLFPAAGGDFDLSIRDKGGELLLVSQFTLLGDCRQGRRPDWARAAPSERARPLYQAVVDGLRREGLKVEEGQFGAKMSVSLINDGPVTIILDSR